ncbi:MAG: 4-hydroxybutyrate CoA-transferase [Deltaproteobacteria bacterium]|nr:4-hydroxybutyrate CoA-transferase [Deltaproteobacteria bacterium]MBW2692653.1 4-hydroxybutyrate CoA-transferase [Deltaproteobacteria bacterium]
MTAWETKLRSLTDAAALVGAKDTLGLPLATGQPSAFLHALGERDDFEELVVFSALLSDLFRIFTRRGVQLRSGFFGPVERGLRAAGHDVRFVPADFRRFRDIAAALCPRIVATAATPPDAAGQMSLSLHAGASVDEIHRAGRDPNRLLIVEVNPALPRTFGIPPEFPHTLSVEEVDVIVESDRSPLILADPPSTPVDRAIAENALPYIASGSTIQIGIGGVPGELADLLVEHSGSDYGVHTEMFTTGLMRLHQAGKVTNQKGIYDGYSITTFAAGTRELYDWLDGREEVRFLPVDQVNAPAIIAQNRQFVSINGALALDLFGQIAADRVGAHQYSGIGGHMDFVSGAAFSAGGHSLICLPSTVEIEGVRSSRISAQLESGACITTPRHEVDVVVTEFGAAELAQRSEEERADALIAIAHPEFRDELRDAWGQIAG